MSTLVRNLKLKSNYSVQNPINIQLVFILIASGILFSMLLSEVIGVLNNSNVLQTMDLLRSQERAFRYDLGERINQHSTGAGELYYELNSFVDGVLNVTTSILPLEYLDKDISFAIGDHLYVNRGFYLHHGIYIGQGRVIGYYGELTNPTNTKVRVLTLEQFSEGDKIHKKYVAAKFPAIQIVNRALSTLGKKDYHVVFNNCEQFVIWCTEGYDPFGYYK